MDRDREAAAAAAFARLHRADKELGETISKLQEFPRRLTVPHKVNVGPLAFFEGELQHTNEVLVLLGDNYFAKMTAPRAAELLSERRTALRSRLGPDAIAVLDAPASKDAAATPKDPVATPAASTTKSKAAEPKAAAVAEPKAADAKAASAAENVNTVAKTVTVHAKNAAAETAKPASAPASSSTANATGSRGGVITIMEEYDSSDKFVGASTMSSNQLKEALGGGDDGKSNDIEEELVDESMFEVKPRPADELDRLIERLRELEALEKSEQQRLEENPVSNPADVFSLMNSTASTNEEPAAPKAKSVRFSEDTKAPSMDTAPAREVPLRPAATLTAVRDVIFEQSTQQEFEPTAPTAPPAKVSRFKAARMGMQ